MGTERETHFRGYAKLLYEDIYWMFNNLFIEEADMEPMKQKAEQTRQGIQSYLSERAYDLACHTLYETSYGLDKFYIPERINENVPDLTKWPE